MFAAAIRETELALQHDPENYEAALNAAFLNQHFAEQENDLNRFAVAESLYRLALPHFDSMPSAHYNYSLVVAKLGRLNDAIREAERAIALDPDFEAAKSSLLHYRTQAETRPNAPESATIADDDA